MSDEIFFDGKRYISANEAGISAGFTRDYVARLCRDGKISGRRVGTHWYVEQASLKDFLVTQEYAKSRRSESLAEERIREYHDTTPVGFVQENTATHAPSSLVKAPAFSATDISAAPRRISFEVGKNAIETNAFARTPVRAHVSRVISSRADEIKNKMAVAVARQSRDGHGQAKLLSSMPGGFAHAALTATHVPVYTLTPLTEFFHKVVALALTLMLTFGTYAAVDPAYARFAANSVRESVDAALDSYHAATGGGLNELANRTQAQVAAAAENPAGTFASIASAFQRTASNLARALNTGINDALYAVSFPRSLTEQSVVAIEVVPSIRKATPTPTTSPSTTPRAIASGPVNQTIINNPVIERVVETTRLVTAGGISEELLDKKIADLDAKLSSRAMVSSAANTTNITNIYSSAASVGRIEHLDELDLTHPTITGGSIS